MPNSVFNRLHLVKVKESKLVEQLKKNYPIVFQIWEERVRQTLSPSNTEGGLIMRDFIPQLLEQITKTFALEANPSWIREVLSFGLGEKLARTEGYSLERALEELKLLRLTLLAVLSKTTQMEIIEIETINDLIEQVMIDISSQFIRTQAALIKNENHYLKLLHEVASQMIEFNSLQKSIDILFSVILENFGGNAGMILVYHPELKRLQLRSSTGIPEELGIFYARLLETKAFANELAASEGVIKTLSVSDLDQPISEGLKENGINFILGIGLFSRHKLLGKICIGYEVKPVQDPTLLKQLQTLSERLATLLDNTDSYAKSRLESEQRRQAYLQSREAVESLELEKEMRERFVSTLTHDLRNPLSAARSYAEMISQHPFKIDHPTLAKKAIESIDRTDRMIRDLLDVTLIRSGNRLPIKVSRVNLEELVNEIINEMALSYGNRFSLEVKSLENAPVLGYWSGEGLRRIIENLIQNACKYGLREGTVLVAIQQNETETVISVHNEGNPMSANEMACIFEQFSRTSHAQTSEKKGWGLGLTLVKGIVESHGGKIDVESQIEKGTTFKVILPNDSRPFQPNL